MNVYERIDNALSGLSLPYYCGVPNLSGERPNAYLVYDVYDVPELFSDGEEHAYTYNVTVKVITPDVNIALRKQVRDAMKSEGFVYRQGFPSGTDDEIYPYAEEYSLEFYKCLEE